jgi:hypothetical protein
MIDVENNNQWLLAKWGMFSASQLFHIMIPGKEDKKTGAKELFSTGGVTYIEKIAMEGYTLFNPDENPMSYDMKMGKIREGQGAAYYINAIGVQMRYYGGGDPLFHLYNKDSGASPDLVLWKDEENKIASFGGEMKCPKSSTHMYYLRNIKNATDLKRESLEYYTQVQFSMRVFQTDLWHWNSYNEYFPEKDKLLLIEVPADKNFQNELDARLDAAIKKKYQLIEELKNRS